MRYNDDLTEEAVLIWAKNNFDGVVSVCDFRQNFVILTKDAIVNVRKTCGTVEVQYLSAE